MASIERTAYPRFPRVLTLKDVQTSFTPRQDEIEWATKFARGTDSRLALLVLLKCFLFLRHFPPVESIPEDIVEHVSASLGMAPIRTISYANPTALYRHHKVIRDLLGVEPYTDAQTRPLAVTLALKAAAVVETRVDIINCVIEDLIRQGHELPVFRTLDDIAEQVHADAQTALHVQIEDQLSDAQRRWLDKLLVTDLPLRRTLYNQLKQSAKKTSRQHLDMLLDQVRWLDGLPACDDLLSTVPAIKLKHMAERAAVLDAGDLKDFTAPKRHALILALIRQMRIRARDDVAEMFIRRIGAVHKRAREELQSIQARQRELSDALVATLEDVLDILAQEYDCATTGQMVRQLLAPDGTVDELRADCEAIRVWSGNNHLPLIWKPFSTWRHAMFRMANALQFEAATQDKRLLNALAVVLANEHKKAEWVEDDVDLSFASERWRKLVRRSHGLGNPTNRRFLEVCVFSHLSSDLRCGDICIEGSEAFADYRQQLLTWEQCKERLAEYCDRLDLATSAQAFVGDLKALLEETAQRVDQAFPEHAGDVVIGSNGEPTLRKVMARDVPASAVALQATIESRNPTRNLLDILANIEHWTGFTRHFGSLSGDDPKLKQARERYLLTVFAMGCNLGPTQAARHLSNGVTPHQLSYANQRHISLDQLDNACRDLTELYLRLDLPKLWGDGKKVAADGTQYDFYDQNLLGKVCTNER